MSFEEAGMGNGEWGMVGGVAAGSRFGLSIPYSRFPIPAFQHAVADDQMLDFRRHPHHRKRTPLPQADRGELGDAVLRQPEHVPFLRLVAPQLQRRQRGVVARDPVEVDDAAVGVELPAGSQDHGVVPALRVGELHSITDCEGSGPVHRCSACQSARRRGCAGLPSFVGVSPYAGLMTDGQEPTASRRPALSPSRAADFKQCPLLYRFRTIDRADRMHSP
mgnify:CR=1 FL=1